MAKIFNQKPYVYLTKTASNYHVSVVVQIDDNQTLTGTQSGRSVTLTITTDPNTPKRGTKFEQWTNTFTIPNPDYRDTDELEVNISGANVDYSQLIFGDADAQTSAPATGEPLPHVFSPKSNSGNFTPRGLIYPTAGYESQSESVTRSKTGLLTVSIDIQQISGANIDNEYLTLNHFEQVKDPFPLDSTTFELKDGPKKRKAKVSNQT